MRLRGFFAFGVGPAGGTRLEEVEAGVEMETLRGEVELRGEVVSEDGSPRGETRWSGIVCPSARLISISIEEPPPSIPSMFKSAIFEQVSQRSELTREESVEDECSIEWEPYAEMPNCVLDKELVGVLLLCVTKSLSASVQLPLRKDFAGFDEASTGNPNERNI
jgi:hypothetical protein